MDKLTEQKAALFDVIRQIELTQNGLNQLIANKNKMLQYLAELESEEPTREA